MGLKSHAQLLAKLVKTNRALLNSRLNDLTLELGTRIYSGVDGCQGNLLTFVVRVEKIKETP